MSKAKNQVKHKRTFQFHFMVTEEEAALIRERMGFIGIVSIGAYMRKMTIDGYVVNLDLFDVRELISLLDRCSNNLNQYDKRANETGSANAANIEDLCVRFDGLWDVAGKILRSLAKIK